jgi:hypothetical protein
MAFFTGMDLVGFSGLNGSWFSGVRIVKRALFSKGVITFIGLGGYKIKIKKKVD